REKTAPPTRSSSFVCFVYFVVPPGRRSEFELRTLREKPVRVAVKHGVDEVLAVAAAAHLERGLRHRERIADAPIAGGVHPDAFAAADFQHVDRTRRRGFGIRIQRDPRPEAAI